MVARSAGTVCAESHQVGRTDEEPASGGTYVRRLRLTAFRNYDALTLDLPAAPVVLTGRNGIGKTNLLEAVSFLTPGKGLRQARFTDILPLSGATGWAVCADLEKRGERFSVGTGYETGDGKKSDKRQIRLNGEPIKGQGDLGESVSAVWLTPAMDRLFSGDPAGRRRFWDRLVQAFDPAHARRCAAYAQALKQWNALLRERRFDDAWLSALEKTLGKYGAETAEARRRLLNDLQNRLETAPDNFPRAALSLDGGLENELRDRATDEAADIIRDRFRRSRSACAETGSVGGIHTVDLSALHREKNRAAAGCSTGEQKALLVSILLAHIGALAERKGALPLVLFDEVFAHLDAGRMASLSAELKTLDTQVWLTGTDPAAFTELNGTARFVAVETLLNGETALSAAS